MHSGETPTQTFALVFSAGHCTFLHSVNTLEIAMDDPVPRGPTRISRFSNGVWGLKIHFLIAAALAGIAMYFFNHRWPEHPIQVDEFIIIWIVMLVPAAFLIAFWRRIFG
jgi:FtsH-binding integral membrane protein